jgi:hypothetical protein
MKDKILIWLGRNRKEIAYTIAGINLLAALSHLIQGQYGLALFWLVISTMIIIDTREY